MKTKILLLSFFMLFGVLFTSNIFAQDVINLTTTDNIATVLSTYSGSNVVLVIPSGYTNPQGTTAIALPAALQSGVKITFRGDGTMPNLIIPSFSVPSAGLNLSAFKFQNLTLTGTSTSSYIINVATGTAFNVDTVSFTGCNINMFRSLVRFQSTNATTIDQKANYILFDNCKLNNSSDYGMVYNNKVGGSFGPIVVKSSTFYGFGQAIFLCQTNTASVSISDCTFDNFTVVPGTSYRYVVDLSAQTSPITITNCIFGLTSTGKYSRGFKTGGTITISNCYRTSDCFYSVSDSIIGTGGITGSIVAYSGTASALFKTPSTSTPGAAFVTTADYTIIDPSFAGYNTAGDKRWYTPTAVNSPKSSSIVISCNSSEIRLSEISDVKIYSITGDLLKSVRNTDLVSIADLAKGVYIIKAGSAIQKFINR